MLYENKNRTILEWLNLNGKSPKEEMREHLKQYFGKEEQRLTDYFSRDRAVGDSSGLSLLLTELILMGGLQNDLPLAVTGKINGEGDVLAIGSLKEKIQIAEKAGFQFMIIPSENALEAVNLQKELKTTIEIFDVNHVDKAVELITYLNGKNN